MAELEKQVMKESKFKLHLWWRYIVSIFSLWEHGEDNLIIYWED